MKSVCENAWKPEHCGMTQVRGIRSLTSRRGLLQLTAVSTEVLQTLLACDLIAVVTPDTFDLPDERAWSCVLGNFRSLQCSTYFCFRVPDANCNANPECGSLSDIVEHEFALQRSILDI